MQDFFGRTEELLFLKEMFKEVKRGNTRFLVINADTGMGKTRLIQEFYHYLSKNEDFYHYWPDMLDDTKHTMTLVPKYDELSSQKINSMPWMWLALRCQNYDERNSDIKTDCALTGTRNQIRLHLNGLFEAKKRSSQNQQVLKSSISMLANYAFPGGGPLIINLVGEIIGNIDKGIGTIDAISNFWNKWRSKKGVKENQVNEVAQQEYTSLVEQTLEVFKSIFNNSDKRLPTIPVVFVVDDAQWADPLTIEFLEKVYVMGNELGWPLFIITTCWESSLKEQMALPQPNNTNEQIFNLGLLLKKFEENDTVKQPSILILEKLEDTNIIKILNEFLPRIPEEAKVMLAQNCSGDLELLWDWIHRMFRTPGFLDKDQKLIIPLKNLRFRSSKKKELARERIQQLGHGICYLVLWGSAQGINFSKRFIDKCLTFFEEHRIDSEEFNKAASPYNLTKINRHSVFNEVAEFQRRLYYEVAREMLEDFPWKEDVLLILATFYKEFIDLGDFNKLDQNEKTWVLEEYLYLIHKYFPNDSNFQEKKIDSQIMLVELYLQEGLFEQCFRLGEDIIRNKSSLSLLQIKIMLGILIEASYGAGDIEKEIYYINELVNRLPIDQQMEPHILYYQSKYQLRYGNAKMSLELANQSVQILNDEDSFLGFNCYVQQVVASFYAGEHEKGLALIRETEKKYSEFLDTNIKYKTEFDHTLYLLFHNLDLNEKSIDRCILTKEGYNILKDRYNYLLSCVNLSDSLLASGRVEEAEEEAKYAYNLAKNSQWKHAHNISAICYANALANNGKLMESFHLYEEGILLSEQIGHQWDMLYGQIWQSLALADFGDQSAFQKLLQYRTDSKERGYDYLFSLASCFSLLTAVTLGLDLSKQNDLIEDILSSVEPSTPGLYSQTISASYFLGKNIDENAWLDFKNLCLKCEGVHGQPKIISRFVDSIRSQFNLQCVESLDLTIWIENYSNAIKEFK